MVVEAGSPHSTHVGKILFTFGLRCLPNMPKIMDRPSTPPYLGASSLAIRGAGAGAASAARRLAP